MTPTNSLERALLLLEEALGIAAQAATRLKTPASSSLFFDEQEIGLTNRARFLVRAEVHFEQIEGWSGD